MDRSETFIFVFSDELYTG